MESHYTWYNIIFNTICKNGQHWSWSSRTVARGKRGWCWWIGCCNQWRHRCWNRECSRGSIRRRRGDDCWWAWHFVKSTLWWCCPEPWGCQVKRQPQLGRAVRAERIGGGKCHTIKCSWFSSVSTCRLIDRSTNFIRTCSQGIQSSCGQSTGREIETTKGG